MKINTRKVLLGLSLLGTTTFVGLATPAQAKPRDRDDRQDVKEARKEVKEARKDVRKADSREDRRDAREDLRDAQRDLNEERRENGNRPGYGNSRPGYGYGRPGYVSPGNGYVRPGNGYVRPGYNRPGYVRPGYQNQNTRTLEGVVLNDLNGNDFTIRTNSGQTVRVLVPSGEPGSLSRGDTVRVSGNNQGGTFVARSIDILRNR